MQHPSSKRNSKSLASGEPGSIYSGPSRRQSDYQANCEALDLNSFKVKPCNKEEQHNHRTCQFYHTELDKRRSPLVVNYEAHFCPQMANLGFCQLDGACTECHSPAEMAYHPTKYRQKFCAFFPDKLESCVYGKYCSYAHGEEEIQTTLLHNYKRDVDFYLYHFKTIFCPYSTPHDRSKCTYAHNWQDFRRDPSKWSYNTRACPDWDRDKTIDQYENSCPRAYLCPFCHGWKEIQFHPNEFRTKPCKEAACLGEVDSCPNFHSPTER